jgi:hypothetical protein
MSRRTRLTVPKRRRHCPIPPGMLEPDNEHSFATGASSTSPTEPHALTQHMLKGTARLQELAPRLWTRDYGVLFEAEFSENQEYLASLGIIDTDLPPTSYRARMSGDAALRYDQRRRAQRRDEMAIRLHSNNQHVWSPSLLARSVTYFNSATATIQSIEGKQRRLASRPTTLAFMRMMRDCRPEPSWPAGEHVDFFVADQTYEWVGMKKRGRRNTVERHDAHGMPVEIKHAVYVNSIRVRLPSLLGNLSAADISAIRANHGSPYTEPYDNVFQPLDFNTIDASLLDFAVDAFLPIVRLGISPELLSMDQIATGLFGRGSVDPGGPSEFEILEPLMDTDTKSYDDFVGIFSHLNRNESASNVVSVFVGDGQSVIQAKNNKVRWPRLYAKWLLMAGGFHEHAHFMFACTKGL